MQTKKVTICQTCQGIGKITAPYIGGNPYYDGDMFGFNSDIVNTCHICKGKGKIKCKKSK